VRNPGIVVFACAALACGAEIPTRTLQIDLRSRVEAFKGTGTWQAVQLRQELPIAKTAIVICDMWDKHWCTGASRRVDALAERMAPVIDSARSRGILIIHSPSDVMDFYKDAPQRRRMMDAAKVAPTTILSLTDPPLPIDDSDGGCDTPDKFYKAWTREHARIRIAPEDGVSDNGAEIYSFLRARGVENILIMGVHTNMCVLNRSFAIRQMTKWGMRCVLVRDLTDSMYDPNDRPFVSHDRGTELVIEHIEKYWAPSVASEELTRALREAK
jgi:nicotinamidase-related amidase